MFQTAVIQLNCTAVSHITNDLIQFVGHFVVHRLRQFVSARAITCTCLFTYMYMCMYAINPLKNKSINLLIFISFSSQFLIPPTFS